MTWANPTPVFLELRVALSLLGILTGFIVVFGMLNGRPLAIWSAAFQRQECRRDAVGELPGHSRRGAGLHRERLPVLVFAMSDTR
jgi:hypothetical protein